MSYNISVWKTKIVENFVLDRFDHTGTEGERVWADGLPDGRLDVGDITYYGVGSGYHWDEFKEALSHSTGKLVAIQIWEGGDWITRLTVEDGIVTQEEVEL